MEQVTVEEQTASWVVEQLVKGGFTNAEAEDLVSRGVDYRTAMRLLGQGCPGELVVRILV